MGAAWPGYLEVMEPIPETREAIDEFGPFMHDDQLLEKLKEMARRVQEVVPACIGLSLAYREHGVTFTLVASDELIAALDGLQYLDDGPCVAAVEAERIESFSTEDVLGEDRWQIFARGTAAAGVASTLTLPIVIAESVVGSVNLYAETAAAFDGKHEAVAAIFDAWAPGAVANADLTFETRLRAQEAPRLLLDEMRIQVAVGVLVATHGISVGIARERLQDAALKAGVEEAAMAKLVIEQATPPS
jgi:GAF domain-containing protein